MPLLSSRCALWQSDNLLHVVNDFVLKYLKWLLLASWLVLLFNVAYRSIGLFMKHETYEVRKHFFVVKTAEEEFNRWSRLMNKLQAPINHISTVRRFLPQVSWTLIKTKPSNDACWRQTRSREIRQQTPCKLRRGSDQDDVRRKR